ncbi:hypothetical protein BJ138DRAFT_127108 [Hygrophoropsis aurantiaca]|uniref:Uncharacterized protein n=1 Tax=Hygrophoropsis aurantiaca TaxID=72124 RepID=A0ACB8AAP3_9AGAM|nr:hypothetical protein BJ138DRAFT_127108 [Hygrophoropsis aurantiaca]
MVLNRIEDWSIISLEDSPQNPVQTHLAHVARSLCELASQKSPGLCNSENCRHYATLWYRTNQIENKTCRIVVYLDGHPDSEEGQENSPVESSENRKTSKEKRHFLINLTPSHQPVNVHNKFENRCFPAPQNIMESLEEVGCYIKAFLDPKVAELWGTQTVCVFLEVLPRHPSRYLRKVHSNLNVYINDERSTFQAIHHKVLASAKSEAKKATEDTCPGCTFVLQACRHCDGFFCGNRECQSWQTHALESCSYHPALKSCLSCRERLGVHNSLVSCPTCQTYYCPADLSWCWGRPQDDPRASTFEFKYTLGGFRDDVVHSHSPKPSPCHTCVSTLGVAAWHNCGSFRCWSKNPALMRDLICPDCVADNGGTRCACSNTWVCDLCAAFPNPHLTGAVRHCPGCQQIYCYDCDFIKFCRHCEKPRLCDSCIEEESHNPPGAPTANVAFTAECQLCTRRVCSDCEEGMGVCANPSCGRIVCLICARSCLCCDSVLCKHCDEYEGCGCCYRSSQLVDSL